MPAEFITVPEERLSTDILKSWITYFSSDSVFSGVTFLPSHPDKDTAFVMPSMMVKRVSEERQILSRVRGYFGPATYVSDSNNVGRLEGFCLKTMYQIDIFTRSISDQNRLKGLVDKKLKTSIQSGGSTVDVFATNNVGPTFIPISDFATPTQSTGTATDLKIRFQYWRDVSWAPVPTFDPELHQLSATVDFWVDYITQNDVPKVLSTVQTYTDAATNGSLQ